MSQESRGQVFGKRDVRHTLILASGDKIRHFNVRPWHLGGVFAAITLFLLGYIGATAYLFMRDDLISALRANQTRMVEQYEDRIAALRQQVDRTKSQQLIDRRQIEDRIAKLYQRQLVLTTRHGQLEPLLERARSAGLMNSPVPVPQPQPKKVAAVDAAAAAPDAISAIDAITGGSGSSTGDGQPHPLINAYASDDAAAAAPPPLVRARLDTHPAVAPSTTGETKVDRVVQQVSQSLRKIETDQSDNLRDLTVRAIKRASAIRAVLDKTGVAVEADAALTTGSVKGGVGGPFIRLDDPEKFDSALDHLNRALDKLESVRSEAEKLPFGRPLNVDLVTSPFGPRRDPFLDRMAFHPGVDLRAAPGTPVQATGAGTVIHAGPDGGYGNMVEIDHGDGVSSLYGHLSRVLVHEGEHVATGAIIGDTGSTGRSTGPHLHYEVRLNGHPVDPERFLDSGLALQALLRG